MLLLGHNGAGKTTFISYLLGLLNDESQHPFLPNFTAHLPNIQNKTIGYSPEMSILEPTLSAADYINALSAIKRVAPDPQPLFELVSLSADPNDELKKYSKGMKQRLLLALAFIGDPQVIVLDEPTSGLDIYGQKLIEELLVSQKDKREFIIATHSLEFAAKFGGQTLIFAGGTIAYEGVPSGYEELEELMQKHAPKALL
jgi:ABC-type multidrug transport system ATPase subunit